MTEDSGYLPETPSQTAGPYVHIGLIPHMAGFDIFQNNFGNVVAGASTKGESITIEGRVIDGSGTLLRDALIEIWQANAEGKYNLIWSQARSFSGHALTPAFGPASHSCSSKVASTTSAPRDSCQLSADASCTAS